MKIDSNTLYLIYEDAPDTIANKIAFADKHIIPRNGEYVDMGYTPAPKVVLILHHLESNSVFVYLKRLTS